MTEDTTPRIAFHAADTTAWMRDMTAPITAICAFQAALIADVTAETAELTADRIADQTALIRA